MKDKVCTKCLDVKNLDEFETDTRWKDGKGSRCKACVNSTKRARKPYNNGKNKLYRRERQALNIQLKSNPCSDCKVQYHWSAMQWDHRPGELKLGDPAKFINSMDTDGFLKEIAKCDLVCANCHAVRTYFRANPDELPSEESI
jgi:hypothetical protein